MYKEEITQNIPQIQNIEEENIQFIEQFVKIINNNNKVKELYQKIIPILQKTKQIQLEIEKIQPHENHKLKDLLNKIKKNNESIQIIITQITTQVLNDINLQ